VQRIAGSLERMGYLPMIAGRKFPSSPKVTLPWKTKHFRMVFQKGPLFYLFFNLKLLVFLIFTKTDSLLANDLDTLPANFLASKIRKIPLIYDSHEYFTEVPELINRRFVRRIWQGIESYIFPRLNKVYTVSSSIAHAYEKKYGVPVKVIRNLPLAGLPVTKPTNIAGLAERKIILYQGTLNKGRGLETAIRSMKFVEGAVLLIAGDGPERKELEQLTESTMLSEKVIFTGKVPPEQLRGITRLASLGIYIEENTGLNYFYALPNKLFDYILAGVPVLVSPFPEMEKIVLEYGVGEVLDAADEKHLAQKFNEMLCDRKKQAIWEKNLKEAAKELCWEKEEELLKEFF